jgi:CMP/dCMP kinase
MIITIDGPAASGKSSASRCLARKLQYYYLYSGLLYRACAYVLAEYAEYTKNKLEKVLFDGIDITPHLKSVRIDDYASLISVDGRIRNAVGVIQKKVSMDYSIVADGRDMGTVVFPRAEIKFFLTASVEVRAHRWQENQQQRGNRVTIQEAIEILTERDQRDTIRDSSPLAVAPDAIMIDNSDLSAAETCNRMEQHIRDYYVVHKK